MFLDVDLISVFLGLRTFMPSLLQQTSKSLLVVTASVAGLFNLGHVNVSYHCAKHGAVLLAEVSQPRTQ